MDDFKFLRNIVKLPNIDKKIEKNLKIREKRLNTLTEEEIDAHQFRVNVSVDKCTPYKELLAELEQVEVDLIYEVYHKDFKVYGYDILPSY